MKDDSGDGAVKGLIWAVVFALVPNQGYSGTGEYLSSVATMLVVFPTIGYLLDAAETNRQPLYRGPSTSPTLKVSWRF
jgi:hypothetical protein